MSLVMSAGDRAAVEPANGSVGIAMGGAVTMGAAYPAMDEVTLVK